MKKYEHEITVYIWKYQKHLGFIPSGHFGHAAVRLRNVPGGCDTYISWWPGSGASKGDAFTGAQEAALGSSYQEDKVSEINARTQDRLQSGRYRPHPGQRRVLLDARGMKAADPLTAVKRMYGQSADLKIRLPAAGLGGIAWGLDIVSMYRWWKIFRRSPSRQYRLLGATDNCAGVAALALLAGLADAFVEPPRAKVFRDPTQAGLWAQQVEQDLVKLNRGPIPPTLHGYRQQFKRDRADELMSLKDFKTRSGEGVRPWVVRRGQAHKIDGLLAKYHAIPWDGSSDTVDNRWRTKIQLLKDMMNQIHLYLAEKPGGKRQEGLLALGEQILNVVEFRFGDKDLWNTNVVKWDNVYD